MQVECICIFFTQFLSICWTLAKYLSITNAYLTVLCDRERYLVSVKKMSSPEISKMSEQASIYMLQWYKTTNLLGIHGISCGT